MVMNHLYKLLAQIIEGDLFLLGGMETMRLDRLYSLQNLVVDQSAVTHLLAMVMFLELFGFMALMEMT